MELSPLDKIIVSSYTSLEKQSIYQLLCAAMAIDGERHPLEKQVIEDVAYEINLTSSEREASRLLNQNTMNSALCNMSDNKKIYLGKFIAQVLLADGKVTPMEDKFASYIFSTLQIPNIY